MTIIDVWDYLLKTDILPIVKWVSFAILIAVIIVLLLLAWIGFQVFKEEEKPRWWW